MLRPDCTLSIELDRPEGTYRPGEEVSGQVVVKADEEVTHYGLTLQWRWRASGRGSTNSGQATSIEMAPAGSLAEGETQTYHFSFEAPTEPFSYEGHHFGIRWQISAELDTPGPFDVEATCGFALEPDPEASERPYTLGGAEVTEETDPEKTRQFGIKVFYGCMVGLALPLFLFGLLMIWGGVRGLDAGGWKAYVFFGAGGFAIVAALALAGAAAYKYISERGFETVDARLEPWSVRPGELVRLKLRVVPAVEMEVETVRATLLGREEVVKRNHSSDRSDDRFRHTVHEKQLEVGARRTTLQPGVPVEWEATFRIPDDAPLSFVDDDNRLEWIVKPLVEITGRPDWSTSLGLIVRP